MATEKRLIDAEHLRRYALYEYMKAKMKHKDDDNFAHWAGIVVAMIEELLKGMPTVDAVEVVHGRWIWHNKRELFEFKYECSICHDGSDLESNYCPNCGAKMDGDGNEP